MTKLVAGVKAIKTTSYTPVVSTEFKTSNGQKFASAAKANAAQESINLRKTSIRLAKFLKSAGVATPSCEFMVTTRSLAKALKDPKFTQRLLAVAK